MRAMEIRVRASAARNGRSDAEERRVLRVGRNAWRRGERCALNARWTHGHRFGARQASVVNDTRPVSIRHVQHQWCAYVESEKDLVGATEIGVARQLLARGFLSGLGNMAEFARFAAVKSHLQRLGRRHHLHIVMKHLRPPHHLNDIPHRAIGTEPGDEETGNGNATTDAQEMLAGCTAGKSKAKKRCSLSIQQTAAIS